MFRESDGRQGIPCPVSSRVNMQEKAPRNVPFPQKQAQFDSFRPGNFPTGTYRLGPRTCAETCINRLLMQLSFSQHLHLPSDAGTRSIQRRAETSKTSKAKKQGVCDLISRLGRIPLILETPIDPGELRLTNMMICRWLINHQDRTSGEVRQASNGCDPDKDWKQGNAVFARAVRGACERH